MLAILVPTSLLADNITYRSSSGVLPISPRCPSCRRGEKTALASSYDRKSVYDAASDAYVAWDANADGHGFVRQEDGKTVMAEIDGPGCIWRIWSATAQKGHVKIYLDAATLRRLISPLPIILAARRSLSRGRTWSTRSARNRARRRVTTTTRRYRSPSRARSRPIRVGVTITSSPTRRFPPTWLCPRSRQAYQRKMPRRSMRLTRSSASAASTRARRNRRARPMSRRSRLRPGKQRLSRIFLARKPSRR